MIRLTSGVYLVYIYKKTAVTTNRCEESYNQADEPSVPFDEKGRVSVRTINLFNIKKVGASKAYSDMEAPPRLELGVKVLQTSALPLGYGAVL